MEDPRLNQQTTQNLRIPPNDEAEPNMPGVAGRGNDELAEYTAQIQRMIEASVGLQTPASPLEEEITDTTARLRRMEEASANLRRDVTEITRMLHVLARHQVLLMRGPEEYVPPHAAGTPREFRTALEVDVVVTRSLSISSAGNASLPEIRRRPPSSRESPSAERWENEGGMVGSEVEDTSDLAAPTKR
ncbi:MAG: hypothetical protein C4321_08670 [Chloroflexota bacterium]